MLSSSLRRIAVKNTAGRRLSAWQDNETFEILIEFCKKRNLPGVIETIAEFERPEAIPCLDRALEDDMCRIAAEDGREDWSRTLSFPFRNRLS